MSKPQRRQYGTWASPITPAAMAGNLSLSDVMWDSQSDTLVWVEGRGKRGVLMAQQGVDAPRVLTGEQLSVKGRVGYGGGAFTVHDGVVYFAADGGRLYRMALDNGDARPITPGFAAMAAPAVSPNGRWLIGVFHHEGQDGLFIVDTDGEHWPGKLIADTDFAMQPVWATDNRHIAYVAWNHPQMPWDGTELRLLSLTEGETGLPTVESVTCITGDEATSIFQPLFSPDGRYLAYISDASGFPHLYLYELVSGEHRQITTGAFDFGQPAWIQGMRVYDWRHDSRAIFIRRNDQGIHSLWRVEIDSGVMTRLDALNEYTSLEQVAASRMDDRIALVASASTLPSRVVSLQTGADVVRVHRRATREHVNASALSEAEPIHWEGHDGKRVYGLYYPPAAGAYYDDGPPPLLVHVHGGPTAQATAGYEERVQFFTTRGYAVLRVNHRGSTGYGREYMRALDGQWGMYDVEDSASGARYLINEGRADSGRLVIMGGSAGGFTVLQSLVDKPGFYRAAICMYGISNQFMLVQDTHKFEARYSDTLLGPLPEAADLYRLRSPFFHAERIKDPVIVFQGEGDVVVPRNQSDAIVDSLRRRGVPHEYHVYAGEGHGFRGAQTIEDVYTRILAFLGQHVLYI